MNESNLTYVGQSAPLKWAISAALVVGIAMLVMFRKGDIGLSLASVASATLSTYFCSWLGVRLLNQGKYSKLKGAIVGLVFGTFALIQSAILTPVILGVTGNHEVFASGFFDEVYLFIIMGFVLGGFLGPICGSLTGFFLAKKLHAQTNT